MKRRPTSVGKTVKSILKNLGVDQIVRRHSIWFCWESIVGPEVAAHTRPEFFSGKCLFITVDHSGWMHQLNFLKDRILQNLNRELGSDSVSELRFRISSQPFQSRSPAAPPRRKPRISKAERLEIEATVSPIHSSELRESLSRIMLKDLTEKKRPCDER